MKTIIHIISDIGDWEGLYVDGKLFNQGPSLKVEDLAKATEGHEFTYIKREWIDMSGDQTNILPQDLKDLVH